MHESTTNTPVSSNTRARTSHTSVINTLSENVFGTMTKDEKRFIKNNLHQLGDDDPAAYIKFDYEAVEAVCAVINNPQFGTQAPDYIMTSPATTAYAFFVICPPHVFISPPLLKFEVLNVYILAFTVYAGHSRAR